MSARKNRMVHTLASIALFPKAVAQLPKAAVEIVLVFKDDVKEEMELRCSAARLVDRDVKN